jgi:hypothetical protein
MEYLNTLLKIRFLPAHLFQVNTKDKNYETSISLQVFSATV